MLAGNASPKTPREPERHKQGLSQHETLPQNLGRHVTKNQPKRGPTRKTKIPEERTKSVASASCRGPTRRRQTKNRPKRGPTRMTSIPEERVRSVAVAARPGPTRQRLESSGRSSREGAEPPTPYCDHGYRQSAEPVPESAVLTRANN